MGQLDYALIGNCQVSALLDKKGTYVWACMPRFDSPSVFSSLIGGEKAGFWDVLPDDDYEYITEQRYLNNTNVLLTEFHLKNGDRFDVIDFAPRFQRTDRHYRPPEFFRIVRPIKGNPRIRMRFRPKLDYGRLDPVVSMVGRGLSYFKEGIRVFLETDIPYSYILDEQSFELTQDRYCVLTYSAPFEYPLKFSAEEFFDRTVSYWRTWVKHCSLPFDYQDAVIRSALALKLHIYEDTGAIIAATTTSIPESPHGGRTWDYRYCWLRDAYFVISILNKLGHFEEMEHFIQYLHNIAEREPTGDVQPVYGISGEKELHERELPWLEGFNGIGPVRVGNAAYTHDQYDVYGEMVLAVTPIFFDSRLDRVDRQRAFENISRLVEQAIKVFDKPDSGIWEFRSEQKHYTFSKVMCWAAVDRGVKIAQRLGKADLAERWAPLREKMRERIETEGWNPKLNIYTQELKGTNADASNLLMRSVNFHQARDLKFKTMVERYDEDLMKNGYAFRYKNEDDFGVPRNAFTICTFWMVDSLALIGRTAEAKKIFENVLARTNHVGLLSEDIDPQTGELWGNFPQTYSHVGIINSAMRLSRPWSKAF